MAALLLLLLLLPLVPLVAVLLPLVFLSALLLLLPLVPDDLLLSVLCLVFSIQKEKNLMSGILVKQNDLPVFRT